jgi:hypothetical protein
MRPLSEPGRHYITPLGHECVALPKQDDNLDEYHFDYVGRPGGFHLRWVNVGMLKPLADGGVAEYLKRFGRVAG